MSFLGALSSNVSWGVALGVGAAGLFYVVWKCCRSRHRDLSYPSLDDKVAIVTGANTGIGFETALEFATRGARVIIGCRSITKGEDAAADLRKRTGNGNVVFKQLDLASIRSIRQFSASILEEEARLDILVNNAGIVESNGGKTEDGFELIFGVNHLGHFLLTNLLLDRLKESPSARIIVVSSCVQRYRGSFDFDMVNKYDTRKLGPMSLTYIQSKVANVLFTRALAKRLEGTRVTANALDPGFVNTQMAENLQAGIPAWRRWLTRLLIQLFFKAPAQGAQTSIYCALSEELEGVSGRFLSGCKELVLTSKGLTSEEDAERLWEVSNTLIDSVKP